MKAIHTASAILAAAAIFLAPAIASAAVNDTEPVLPAVTAPVEGPVTPPPAPELPKATPPAAVGVAPEAPAAPEPVAPVPVAPVEAPQAPAPDASLVLYPSQLPACDDGSGAVYSGGVPVSSCVWNAGGGTFVAVR